MEDPYKEVPLSEIAESSDPEAMYEAVKKQKQKKAYFERLKQKLDRGMQWKISVRESLKKMKNHFGNKWEEKKKKLLLGGII